MIYIYISIILQRLPLTSENKNEIIVIMLLKC